MDLEDKIKEIEKEIEKTPYNKATQHHIGKLKAKLAKLREKELKTKSKKKSGVGFGVRKTGHATAVLIGFPSVGKSTLLNKLTNAESPVGLYDFTTLDVIPGMLEHENLSVQILDLPGVISGASIGKGRGREVLSVVRNADLVIILLEVDNTGVLDAIVGELYNVGIRLDRTPPDVSIKKRGRGGVNLTSTVKSTRISVEGVRAVLNEYGVHNADVVLREDLSLDDFIDVVAGNRVYVPSLIVVNKIDLKGVRSLGFEHIPVSAEKDVGLDRLRDAIVRKIDAIRVYLRPQGGVPDMDEPLILKKGSSVRDLCMKIHEGFLDGFRYAIVWGESAKHPGQHVGLKHVLKDGDVITIIR
jgi:small GTP-binding protein